MNRFTSVWLASTILAFHATPAVAATRDWNGSQSNVWTNNLNWTANVVPVAGDTARIDLGANGPVITTTIVPTLTALQLGLTATG